MGDRVGVQSLFQEMFYQFHNLLLLKGSFLAIQVWRYQRIVAFETMCLFLSKVHMVFLVIPTLDSLGERVNSILKLCSCCFDKHSFLTLYIPRTTVPLYFFCVPNAFVRQIST